MVVGTGIDVIEVARIETASRQQPFMDKVFTVDEQEYFKKRNYNCQTIAGTFAAKEATAKALAAGFNGIRWIDIEILPDADGKPTARLIKAAFNRMMELGGRTIHISISHIKTLAIAQAILED